MNEEVDYWHHYLLHHIELYVVQLIQSFIILKVRLMFSSL